MTRTHFGIRVTEEELCRREGRHPDVPRFRRDRAWGTNPEQQAAFEHERRELQRCIAEHYNVPAENVDLRSITVERNVTDLSYQLHTFAEPYEYSHRIPSVLGHPAEHSTITTEAEIRFATAPALSNPAATEEDVVQSVTEQVSQGTPHAIVAGTPEEVSAMASNYRRGHIYYQPTMSTEWRSIDHYANTATISTTWTPTWDSHTMTTASSNTVYYWPSQVSGSGYAAHYDNRYVVNRDWSFHRTPEQRELQRRQAEDYAARQREREALYAAERQARAEAEETANRLLLSILDEANRKLFLERKEIIVHGSRGGRYCIRHGRAHNVDMLDEHGCKIENLCAHVIDDIPNADNMAAQMLIIQTDEDHFRQTANISRYSCQQHRGTRRPHRERRPVEQVGQQFVGVAEVAQHAAAEMENFGRVFTEQMVARARPLLTNTTV
jgi:hypothetical protein